MSEVIPWAEFQANFRWGQGEHITMVGRNGCGKTNLALALLQDRNYVVGFGTKPKDKTLDLLQRNHGWKRIQSIDERPGNTPDASGRVPPKRLLLWPTFRTIQDADKHGPVFQDALEQLFAEQNWTLFADEIGYITRTLGLQGLAEKWWRQGRSIGLSFVTATQRPAWIPLDAYSEANHLFLWQATDKRNLDRLKEISGPTDGSDIRGVVRGLNFHKYQVLYVNTTTGYTAVTVPPKL